MLRKFLRFCSRALADAKKSLASTSSLLFLAVVALNSATLVYLIAEGRIPRSHDGFQYFTLQYYFLNDTVHSSAVPQWLPFMSQGTVSTWWYAVQAGLLQNVLLLTAGAWRDVHFLPLFYAGFFVDELLLTVGVWLLCRRFFLHPATWFFVTLSVTGSAVWFDQPWYGLHFFYAVPLVLHFLHRFLDSGQWRYIALAGNLLLLQMLGNLPYLFPMATFVVFAYAVLFVAYNPSTFMPPVRLARRIVPMLATLASLGATLWLVYSVQTSHTELIANYNHGRNADGTVSAGAFLTYAGTTGGFSKWSELIFGVSPAQDYTLYAGILVVPLSLLGLLYRPRRRYLFFATLGGVLFLLTGTGLAVLLYHAWPLMNYFRHLALASCFIKIVIIFLAGFGVEVVFFQGCSRLVTLGFAGLMFILGGFQFLFALDYQNAVAVAVESVDPYLPFSTEILAPERLGWRLQATALASMAAGVVFLLSVPSNPRRRLLLLICFLSVQSADLYTHRWQLLLLKTSAVDSESHAHLYFAPMPYAARRTPPPEPGSRAHFAHTPRASLVPDLEMNWGAQYWSLPSFLYLDEPGSSYRIDHWLVALDRFMRAYWKQPINDRLTPPAGLRFYMSNRGLDFPLDHTAAAKYAGCKQDKIQFFATAHLGDSEQTIADFITAPQYQGDCLFVTASEAPLDRPQPLPDPDADERLALPCRIESFTSNRLILSVDQTTKPVWLMYSDVWHPLWQAKVDGQPVPVRVANLAYKAIELPAGATRVEIEFGSRRMAYLMAACGWLAVFWVGAILVLAAREIFCSGHLACQPKFDMPCNPGDEPQGG